MPLNSYNLTEKTLKGRLPEVLGQVIFVDSSTGNANGDGSSQRPFSSISSAMLKSGLSSGDAIVCLPGHVETVSAASGIGLNIAGISIIGMGAGASRPTVTLDTAATATIAVSAANVSIKNIVFTANFADIVSLFTTTNANNFKLDNCYFKATATNMNFLNIVDTDATTGNASGLTIVNSKWIEPDTATDSLVKMDGTNADILIEGNFLQLGVKNNTASVMAVAAGKVVTNLQIISNRVFRLNTDTATGAILFSTNGSTNSGIVANNFVQHADVAAELLITASSGLGTFSNFASGVAGASGYVLPAIDS